MVLATCGCADAGVRGSAPIAPEQPAPSVWVEPPPSLEPDRRVDAAAWTGEWTEYFPGRGICQDRFRLDAVGPAIVVASTDCGTGDPYTITDVHWDGQTLRFVAEAPNATMILRYTVTLAGPDQISGTANDTAITWSRTS